MADLPAGRAVCVYIYTAVDTPPGKNAQCVCKVHLTRRDASLETLTTGGGGGGTGTGGCDEFEADDALLLGLSPGAMGGW